jgi:hypothetical protein
MAASLEVDMPARRSLRSVSLLAVLGAATVALAMPSASDVRKAFKSNDKAKVTQVLQELRGNLDKQSVKAVLSGAMKVKSLGVYDDMLACLATAQGDALAELIKEAKRNKRSDMRYLAVDALGKNPDPGAEAALGLALEKDKDETVAVLAARSLGRRNSPGAVDVLIPILEEIEDDYTKTRLKREINGALAQLTGQDITVAQDWKNYWDSHKAGFEGSGPPAYDPSETRTRDESVMDRMRRERPAETRTMESLGEDDIVVIKGRSDKVEDVLKALDLPHVRKERNEFDSLDLDPARQVLVLNCAGKEDLSEAGVQKVREFVAGGGYVFSSDWELRGTLEKAFPEVIGFLKESPREDRKVTIRPNPEASNHPLLRDVFPLSSWVESDFTWTLDSRSHLIKANPNLTVLVESPEIKDLGSTAVAVTFGFSSQGGGRPVTGIGGRPTRGPQGGQVLHVLSHFKNQKDASGDGFALQQILLNFILEKQEARKVARAAGR